MASINDLIYALTDAKERELRNKQRVQKACNTLRNSLVQVLKVEKADEVRFESETPENRHFLDFSGVGTCTTVLTFKVELTQIRVPLWFRFNIPEQGVMVMIGKEITKDGELKSELPCEKEAECKVVAEQITELVKDYFNESHSVDNTVVI